MPRSRSPVWGAVRLLACAVGLILGCARTGPVESLPQEVPGRIAYLRGADVWIWSAGRLPVRVTRDNRNLGPLWSSDGQWLVFLRREGHTGELWAVRPDGTGLVPIAPGRRLPYTWTTYGWSPRGDALALVALSEEGMPEEIWITEVNADGPGVSERLLHAPEGIQGFTWSPDGAGAPQPPRLVVVPAGGGDARAVIRWPKQPAYSDGVPSWTATDLGGLTWSPDGKWISTFAFPAIFLVPGPFAGPEQAEGGPGDPRGLGMMLAHPQWMRWAPAGERLELVAGGGRNASRLKRLMLHDPTEAAEPVSLTPEGSVDRDPAWSPGGDRIAVSRATESPSGTSAPSGAIWLIEPERGKQEPVTGGAAGDYGPLWSRDGSSLLWVRVAEEGAAIWWASVDGTAVKQRAVVSIDSPPGLYGTYQVAAVLSWHTTP